MTKRRASRPSTILTWLTRGAYRRLSRNGPPDVRAKSLAKSIFIRANEHWRLDAKHHSHWHHTNMRWVSHGSNVVHALDRWPVVWSYRDGPPCSGNLAVALPAQIPAEDGTHASVSFSCRVTISVCALPRFALNRWLRSSRTPSLTSSTS